MKFSKMISFSQIPGVPGSLGVIDGIFFVQLAILSIVWEVKRLGIRNTESSLRLLYRAGGVGERGVLTRTSPSLYKQRFQLLFYGFCAPAGVGFRQNIMSLQTSRDAPYQKTLAVFLGMVLPPM
jgi:hypothetical protein